MWKQKHHANSYHYYVLMVWMWLMTSLPIDWNSQQNQAAVNNRVGCQCKTGHTTGRCECQNCAEGCLCLYCLNLPNISGGEKQTLHDTAELELEIEEKRAVRQYWHGCWNAARLGTLLANSSDTESSSESGADSESNSDHGNWLYLHCSWLYIYYISTWCNSLHHQDYLWYTLCHYNWPITQSNS